MEQERIPVALSDPRAILATEREIAHMSDPEAVERIDLLREAAKQAGDPALARALLNNAVRIAGSNYVCLDVITQYADFLEGLGMPEYAAEYRKAHQSLDEMLRAYDAPAQAYEARVREANHKRIDELSDAREAPEVAWPARALPPATSRAGAPLAVTRGR